MKYFLTYLMFFMCCNIAKATNNKDIDCLAEAIYFEISIGSFDEKLAVANVVKNRVLSRKYPNNYCSVVYQKAQFSFVANKKRKIMFSSKSYKECLDIAIKVYYNKIQDNTKGSLYFVTKQIAPRLSWLKNKILTRKFQYHWFYR